MDTLSAKSLKKLMQIQRLYRNTSIRMISHQLHPSHRSCHQSLTLLNQLYRNGLMRIRSIGTSNTTLPSVLMNVWQRTRQYQKLQVAQHFMKKCRTILTEKANLELIWPPTPDRWILAKPIFMQMPNLSKKVSDSVPSLQKRRIQPGIRRRNC